MLLLLLSHIHFIHLLSNHFDELLTTRGLSKSRNCFCTWAKSLHKIWLLTLFLLEYFISWSLLKWYSSLASKIAMWSGGVFHSDQMKTYFLCLREVYCRYHGIWISICPLDSLTEIYQPLPNQILFLNHSHWDRYPDHL